MENFNPQIRQIEQNPLAPKKNRMEKELEEREISLEMKNFYEKYLKKCLEAEKVNSKAETEVKKITLETLKELKEKKNNYREIFRLSLPELYKDLDLYR